MARSLTGLSARASTKTTSPEAGLRPHAMVSAASAASMLGGGRVLGFGHRVYRTEDPRSAMLRETALVFDDPLVPLAIEVEATALRLLAAHRPDREIRTNVEYYAGVVLHLAGIPAPLFPACFAISRSIGWTAHMLEQASNNRIIRPKAAYSGPPPARA